MAGGENHCWGAAMAGSHANVVIKTEIPSCSESPRFAGDRQRGNTTGVSKGNVCLKQYNSTAKMLSTTREVHQTNQIQET